MHDPRNDISQLYDYLNRPLFWNVKETALGRGGFSLPRAPKGAPTRMNSIFLLRIITNKTVVGGTELCD